MSRRPPIFSHANNTVIQWPKADGWLWICYGITVQLSPCRDGLCEILESAWVFYHWFLQQVEPSLHLLSPSTINWIGRTSTPALVVNSTVTCFSVPNFSCRPPLFLSAAQSTFSFAPQAVLTFTSSLLQKNNSPIWTCQYDFFPPVAPLFDMTLCDLNSHRQIFQFPVASKLVMTVLYGVLWIT